VLEMALENTRESHGSFTLQAIGTRVLQGRAMDSLAKNELVDIVWTMTSHDREARLLPIRIPLLKGLLGYRIFIIRKRSTNHTL
jgi:hypothetical protein